MVIPEEVLFKRDDHNILELNANDHHAEPAFVKFSKINQAIGALSTYNYDITVPDAGSYGYKMGSVIIRGDAILNDGYRFTLLTICDNISRAFGMSTSTAKSSQYNGFYMMGFSKVHGDSALSDLSIYGTSIRIKDAYLLNSTTVRITFENLSAVSRNMTCYGTVTLR